MLKFVAMIAGMWVTLILCRPSVGRDTITIGGVEVPADCALARHEHPRLLFTKADLPGLRARLKHPRIAAELEHAKRLAAEGKAGPILLGVLYYLTDQREYIHQAKAMLQPSWVQTYPLAADLVECGRGNRCGFRDF